MRYTIFTAEGETIGKFRTAAAVLIECSAIFASQGNCGVVEIFRNDGQTFSYPAADNSELRKRLERP